VIAFNWKKGKEELLLERNLKKMGGGPEEQKRTFAQCQKTPCGRGDLSLPQKKRYE